MALIKCNKCGKEISDRAKKCPHCGTKKFKESDFNKKHKIVKNIIFVISTLVSIIIGIIAFVLLVDSIIRIPKLNYPLTSILPIITCLLAISFSILFIISMNKYRKKYKVKKFLIISLVLFISMIILYFITGPINRFVQYNDIGYKNQGVSTYFVGGISYEVPNKWRTEKTESGYYHYPYVENSDGVLYVFSKYDTTYDDATEEDLEWLYESVVEGMKDSNSTQYFKILSEESIEINNKKSHKIRYKTLLGDNYLECEGYIILDLETNTMYGFSFAIKDSIPSVIEKDINNIISSIRER